LIADVPDAVEFVETDSGKLKQAIINLVGNALKFTHEGSVTVRLETASDGKTPTAISVVDTGIGIPADRLEAIFEAFQQAEAGTSRKYGGTGLGLGLALSRSICLLMGYELIVESEEGKGSTFKIVMGERAKRPEKADEAGSDALPETRGPTEAVEASSAMEASDGDDGGAASRGWSGCWAQNGRRRHHARLPSPCGG
jgi:signal transduction histidine kinase